MEGLASVVADDVGDINEIVLEQMSKVHNYITSLLDIANDPQRHGELINVLDPTIDKVEKHIAVLQTQLTEELEKKVQEFEVIIRALNSPATILGSQPPSFLSDVDKERWHKLAVPKVLIQQLVSFKESLMSDFREKMFKQLPIEKVTDHYVTMKKILSSIRKTLII